LLPFLRSVAHILMEIEVSPMDIRIGDVFTDSRSEWEVIGEPFSTREGRIVHARVRKADQPDWTDLRTWEAHEKMSVRRG
jgi:hypothetical protein